MKSQLLMFVVCAPGLEPMLAEELRALAVPASDLEVQVGGVQVRGDLARLYQLNLSVGLALKVLLRMGVFRARRFDTLVKQVATLPWETWCPEGLALEVRAHCKTSKLYHSGAVIERILLGITERLGRPVARAAEGELALAIQARLVDDECTLSIDTSGELLHRRGYRKATGKAPLREDLARALIVASGWDHTTALCDPFAGSGTIAIEADWLARGVPPGHLREFAFMRAPSFDARVWQRVRAKALAGMRTKGPLIHASDRDRGAIVAARANAERAGSEITISEAALSLAPGLAATTGALCVVTNPPYGKRLGHDATVARLYRALGQRLRELSGDVTLAMTVADPEHAYATGWPLRPALMTDHGGSKIYFSVSHLESPAEVLPGARDEYA